MTNYNCDVHNVNAKRNESIVVDFKKCSNHQFLLEQLKTYLDGEKPHAQTVAWSYDTWKGMRKFSLKDVVSWQLRKVEQLYKVSSLCFDDHQFKQEELKYVG